MDRDSRLTKAPVGTNAAYRLREDFTVHQIRFLDAIRDHVPDVLNELSAQIFPVYEALRRQWEANSKSALQGMVIYGGNSKGSEVIYDGAQGSLLPAELQPKYEGLPIAVWKLLEEWMRKYRLYVDIPPSELEGNSEIWTRFGELRPAGSPSALMLLYEAVQEEMIHVPEPAGVFLDVDNPNEVFGIACCVATVVRTLSYWYEHGVPASLNWIHELRLPEIGDGVRYPAGPLPVGILPEDTETWVCESYWQKLRLPYRKLILEIRPWDARTESWTSFKELAQREFDRQIQAYREVREADARECGLTPVELKNADDHFAFLAKFQVGGKAPKDIASDDSKTEATRNDSGSVSRAIHKTAPLVAGPGWRKWLHEEKRGPKPRPKRAHS